MTIRRMVALGLVFLLATGAWGILGSTAMFRTNKMSGRLGAAVQELWGAEITQVVPVLKLLQDGELSEDPVIPDSARIDVQLSLEHRRKGQIWYPTYVSQFDAAYVISNPDVTARDYQLTFYFPMGGSTYDQFALYENNERVRVIVDPNSGLTRTFSLQPGETRDLRFAYETRGMKQWVYRPVSAVNQVRGLDMTITTDFEDIDYTPGSLSPMLVENHADGMKLSWKAEDLLTDRSIGIVMPERVNPGPLTSRMTFFAPVCLFFFFVLIGTINIVSRVNIHPMHYLFVACGFFAFHLMLAYLIDVLDIHVSFLISAIISVGLVTFYLRAALGERFPWKVAMAGQLFFLVLFSYSFFVKGMTGLTVATGSVITLAVIMRVTAKLDWTEVFSRHKKPTPPPMPEPA